MKNILAVDIGNTNITVGLFKGNKLSRKTKIPTNSYSLYARSIKALIARAHFEIGDVSEAVISSVVPLSLARFIVELRKLSSDIKITVLGKDKIVPIKNLYRIKKEVGQDRLVNAYAAKMLYGAPAVVVDSGTAITFDIISKKGDYLGGLILPGIELSLSSLYRRTALLPKVELKDAPSIIGKDTVNSMRGGILFGFGAMIDGLAAKYRKILGKDAKIIATGGNSKLIKKYAKSIQMADEDLTLKGLYLISAACAEK
ncbi:MAG: type III pantothenate kinase [Candidatus Omnitrophota bacterium]|nr:type III pantothenate kinase [Candidatus Omnitrophota bacterium]